MLIKRVYYDHCPDVPTVVVHVRPPSLPVKLVIIVSTPSAAIEVLPLHVGKLHWKSLTPSPLQSLIWQWAGGFPIGKIRRDPVQSRRSGIKFGRVERKEIWLLIQIANSDVAVVFITTAIDIQGIRAGIARRLAQVGNI